MKATNTTPIRRSIPDKTSIVSDPAEKEELYKGGLTAAEITKDFNQSLRSPILITKTNISRPLSMPKKASHYAGNRTSVRRGSFKKGSSGGLTGYAGNRGSVRGDRMKGGDFPDMGDRRPSMGTITSQVCHQCQYNLPLTQISFDSKQQVIHRMCQILLLIVEGTARVEGSLARLVH